jgi:thiamine kinase-like enzyme
LIRRYHGLQQFAGRFDVFRTVSDGLAFCRQCGVPLPARVGELDHRLHDISLAVRRRQLPLAACHNDLLPSNFLQQADGRLWLLDWEYTGWGDPFLIWAIWPSTTDLATPKMNCSLASIGATHPLPSWPS